MDKRTKLLHKVAIAIAPFFTQRALAQLGQAPDTATPQELEQALVSAARDNAFQVSLWARFIVEAIQTQSYAAAQTAQRTVQIRILQNKIASFQAQLAQTQKGIAYPHLPDEQRLAIEETITRKIQEFETELARLQEPVRDLPETDPVPGRAPYPRSDGAALDRD